MPFHTHYNNRMNFSDSTKSRFTTPPRYGRGTLSLEPYRDSQFTFHKNSFTRNQAFQPVQEQKIFTQRLNSKNNIKISLEYVTETNLPQINFELWFRKLMELIKSNQWTPDQLLSVLENITDEYFHRFFAKKRTLETILQSLKKSVFPEERFFEILKHQSLKTLNFTTHISTNYSHSKLLS